MVSALSKEIEMLENQLNKSKSAAAETSSLRDEADSLKVKLTQKVELQVFCFIQILVIFQFFKD
jgi:flagellar hook-associated protein FlgK